jgi:SAM-dependent methyltransferase
MLARAADRLPGVPLLAGDAESFAAGSRFDAVTSLFSVIGYVGSLDAAVANMARHLTPGGVLVIEPWLYPQEYKRLHVGSDYTDTGRRTIYRMSHSGVDPAAPNVSVLTMHYLVGSPSGISHWTDTHRMTMFTREEFTAAYAAAGLSCEFVDPGFGRGVVVGR